MKSSVLNFRFSTRIIFRCTKRKFAEDINNVLITYALLECYNSSKAYFLLRRLFFAYQRDYLIKDIFFYLYIKDIKEKCSVFKLTSTF